MTLLTIEGNVGSGKEHIFEFFKKNFSDSITLVEDSVYNWKDKHLLEDFYNDPKRWGLTLEIHSLTRKCNSVISATRAKKPNDIIITKRSPISDNFCYYKACVDSGYISEYEDQVYQNVFNTYKFPQFHGIIYLRSNVNKCYENIVNNTDCIEKKIDFDYLNNIHLNYESWIEKIKSQKIPLIEIDAEQYRDLNNNEMLQQRLINTIINKFGQLRNYRRNN